MRLPAGEESPGGDPRRRGVRRWRKRWRPAPPPGSNGQSAVRRTVPTATVTTPRPAVPADPQQPPHPRGHGRPPAGLPALPGRGGRGQDRHDLLGAAGRDGRRQRRQGAQGPLLPRLLRHPGRRLRRRVPALPDQPRAGAHPGLAGRHRRHRQPGPRPGQLPGLLGPRLPRRRPWSTPTGAKVGEHVGGLAVRHLDELPADRAAEHGIAIGVIATPAGAAQDVADRLVAAGVRVDPQLRPGGAHGARRACRCARSTCRSSCRSSSFYQQRRAAGRRRHGVVATARDGRSTGRRPLYPVNLVVDGRPCLVVGGGAVAARKATGLLACGAGVHVVAPRSATRCGPRRRHRARSGPTGAGEVAGYRLVMAATDDPDGERRRVRGRRGGRASGSTAPTTRPTARSPCPPWCGGAPLMRHGLHRRPQPGAGRWLRRRLEAEIGPGVRGARSSCCRRSGDALRADGRLHRGVDWQKALDSEMLDLIRAGRRQQARERLAGVSVVVVGLNHRTRPARAPRADDGRRPQRLPKALHDLVGRDEPHRGGGALHVQPHRDLRGRPSGSTAPCTTSATSSPSWPSLPPEDFTDHLYTYHDDAAVEHLFRVAAGLDSAVLGESEILGQVRDAWERARAEGAAGPQLSALFRHAVEVGKRARSETGIGRGTTSVSQAAVAMAAERLGTLAGRRVLVLGAGDMGGGMAAALAAAPAWPRCWSPTAPGSGRSTLAGAGGRPGRSQLGDLPDGPGDVDVLLTSTGAPSIVRRRRRPAPVHGRPGPTDPCSSSTWPCPATSTRRSATCPASPCSTWTTCGPSPRPASAERRREVARVRAIVAEEVGRYVEAARRPPGGAARRRAARAGRGAAPRRAGALRARLAGLDARQRAAVDALTRGIVAKLLHEPTVRLKDAAGTPRGERLAEALARAVRPLATRPGAALRVGRPAAERRWPAWQAEPRRRRPAARRRRRRRGRARRGRDHGRPRQPTCRSGRSAARACSSRRCRPPCSTGGPTSPSTRPRTCRRRRRRGLVIAAVPERGDPRDALVGLHASTTCRPAAGWPPARCGGGPSWPAPARPHLRRPAGQHRHPAGQGGRLRRHRGGRRRPRAAGPSRRRRPRCSTPAVMLPQVGQGALAVECRADDDADAGRAGRHRARAVAPGGRRRAGLPAPSWAAAATCRSAPTPPAAGDGRHQPRPACIASRRRPHRRCATPATGRRSASTLGPAPWPATCSTTPAGPLADSEQPAPSVSALPPTGERHAGAVTVYLVGAGPGRSRACSPCGAPRCWPGPTWWSTTGCRWRRCSTWRRRGASGSAWARRPAAPSSPRRRSTPCSSSGAGPGRGRAAQGRRPVRVRPRRRGGAGPAGGRRAVRGRPRHHVGRRRPRLRRRARHPPGPVHLVHRRHRPRGPVGRRPRPTGRRVARVGGTIVVLMGVAHRADDRRAADGRRPRPPTRRWPPCGGAPGPSSARCAPRWPSSPTLALEPPVDDRHRRRWPASTWPGSSAGPLFGRRVVVTRAREQASGLVDRLHAARRRGGGGARPSRSATRPTAGPPSRAAAAAVADATTGSVFTSANAVERFFALLPRRPGLRRRPGGGHRAGHGRAPWPPAASSPTWCPSGSWPRRCSRPSRPAAAAGCCCPGRRWRATCCPTACGPRAGTSTWSRPTAPAGRRRRRAAAPRRPRPTPSPSPRRRRSTRFLEAAGAGRRAARGGVHRAGHGRHGRGHGLRRRRGATHTVDGLVDALVDALGPPARCAGRRPDPRSHAVGWQP